MGFFKGALLFIVSMLISFSLSTFILGFSAMKLLDEKVYLDALEESSLYGFALEKMGSDTPIVPSEAGLKQTAEIVLTGFFSYIRGDTDVLTMKAKLDIEQLKRGILAHSGKSDCPKGKQKLADGKACIPEGKTKEQVLDEELAKAGLASGEVELADVYFKNKEDIAKVRQAAIFAQIGVWLALAFSLFLCFMAFLLHEKSLKKTSRFVGISFLLTGLSIAVSYLVVTLVALPMAFEKLDSAVESPEVKELVPKLLGGIISPFLSRIVILAGIATLLGAALLVFSIIRKEPETSFY